MSKLYRKKPIVVEAIRYNGDKDKFKIAEFMKGHGEFSLDFNIDKNETMKVNLSETSHFIKKGDWLIRGVVGEIYPCSDAVFKLSYEEV